jgi:hypothetical protein
MFNGHAGGMNLGALARDYTFSELLYIIGGLLFGIATFRAGILSRWAGDLLALAAVSTFAAAVIPHTFDRILAVPMGLAFVWLGSDLFQSGSLPRLVALRAAVMAQYGAGCNFSQDLT